MLYPDSSFSFWIDVALICVAFAVISTILIFILKLILDKSVSIFPWLWNRPDRVRPKDEFFQNREVKRAKLKMDKVVTYGQNTFACDNRKKKIFIQTFMDSDGILLDYKDIISFEVLEDYASDDKALCSALTVKIKTGKPAHAEIPLPYILTPEDRSGFVYASASSAVKDVTAILDNISLVNTV
jgi:hypothetical protein